MPSKQDPVQPTYLELEQETTKIVCAIATRNRQIGNEIIASLRDRFTLEAMAGIVLIGLERLIWQDSGAFIWAVHHLLPTDVQGEIHRIVTLHIGKRLIDRGFMPGQDFSLDSTGKLLLNPEAKLVVSN